MRYLWLLMAPLMLAQSGCDTTYPNEEMDIAGSDRTRPFAIVCEPAEAVPGEMVTVTMHYYEPDPDNHNVTWQVALDYDLGLYEADEVERDIVTLDAVNAPTWDEHGFCTQTFTYVIPDDALLRASSQPEVITDELVLALAREVMNLEADESLWIGSPPAKRPGITSTTRKSGRSGIGSAISSPAGSASAPASTAQCVWTSPRPCWFAIAARSSRKTST